MNKVAVKLSGVTDGFLVATGGHCHKDSLAKTEKGCM